MTVLPAAADPMAADFREPWQAKAFALVVLLHRQGHFAWDEWVRTLAAEIAAQPQRAGEEAGAAYHRQVLAALETITAARGLATPETLSRRARQWRQAYLNTPHGQAVELARAGEAAEHEGAGEGRHGHHHGHGHRDHGHHDHGHHGHHHGLVPQRAPVAVSPARVPGPSAA